MIDPREFEPLPYYSWIERPASVPLTHDEAATAIFLARGDLSQAASLLKVPPRPKIMWLTAADLPSRVAEGLRDAIRRKIAEENPDD
jgi:hypothetical protein